MTKGQPTKHNLANKDFSGLLSSVFRFNFCNGGQEHLPGRQAGSPQSLTSHTVGTLCLINSSRNLTNLMSN